MTRVVIAGGGLAGLVAARHLAAADVEVTVFERRSRVGGRVQSLESDGYVFDRGFQVLLDAYPAARRELDYDELELRRFPPGAIIGRADGRSLLVDPLREPSKLSASLFSEALTFGDKLRTLRLRRELGRTPDDELFAGETVSIREGLEVRGFSDRFIENFAAPFFGGITLDRSLGTDWDVFRYTFAKLARGHAAVPAQGMNAIPAQLAATARDAGARIETDAAVATVDGASTDGTNGVVVEVDGETIAADGAVIATDPPTARELSGVDGIPATGVGCTTQYYSLPAAQKLGVDGRLLLNATDATPNIVVPHSEVAPGYAPAGHALVSATFLHEGSEPPDGGLASTAPRDASEGELVEATRSALLRWFPERNFESLELLETVHVPFAQFAQPPGFRARLPGPDAPAGPVVLAGDYTQWSSIQGALESGRVAARTLREYV